jgi:putative membrane protein
MAPPNLPAKMGPRWVIPFFPDLKIVPEILATRHSEDHHQKMTHQRENHTDFITVVCTFQGTVLHHCFLWIAYVTLLTAICNFKMVEGKSYYGLMQVSLSGLSVLGGLLSFLVVFRTNIAYSRFWEARGIIGGGIKICRALAAQTCTFIDGDSAAAKTQRDNLLRLIRVSFSAIVHEVRADAGKTKWSDWLQTESEVTEEEQAIILVTDSPALVFLQLLREALFSAQKAKMVTGLTGRTMDQSIDDLIGTYNGVTKIDSTPIPFAFNQMCKLFIFVFCTMFPFALEKEIGPFSMVIAPLAAYALFGLDHISTQMMNPFGTDKADLPLLKMVASVAADTRLAAKCQVGASAFPIPLATPKIAQVAVPYGIGVVNTPVEESLTVSGSML